MSSLGLHVLWEVSFVRYPSPHRSHLRTEVAPVSLTGRPHRALDRCPLFELPLMGREAASRPRTPGFPATERALSGTLESTESCCKSRWRHGSAHFCLSRNLELVLRLRRRHHLLSLRTSGVPGVSRVLFGDSVALHSRVLGSKGASEAEGLAEITISHRTRVRSSAQIFLHQERVDTSLSSRAPTLGGGRY